MPHWPANATRTLTLGLSVLAVGLAGCGDGRPERVPISGQVLIDDRPLAHGQIQFVPKGARPSRGVLDSQGRFQLSCFDQGDGAVLGEHTVLVSAGEQISPTKTLWHAPKKYTNVATSGVTQEIKEPTDQVVVRLSWEGGSPFVEDDNTGTVERYRPANRQRK